MLEVGRGKQENKLISGSEAAFVVDAGGYLLISGDMGEVLRAVFWLAKMGVGCDWCWGVGILVRMVSWVEVVVGAVEAGRGEVITVPKGEKEEGVRGCSVIVKGCGGERIGRVIVEE